MKKLIDMEFAKDVPLKKWNTFGLAVNANYFLALSNESDLTTSRQLVGDQYPFILGGGSNILFLKDVQEPLLRMQIKGITVTKEDNNHVWVTVNAGEVWHDFVLYCIQRNWGGVENLSLIPGFVGAAPIQNIGAYGVEVKEVLESVRYFDWQEQIFKTISNDECHFEYRDSIFKRSLKSRAIITSVNFKLDKKPTFHLDYGNIKSMIKDIPESLITIKMISDAVIQIRQSKLPDPNIIGNGGSFFKNPIVAPEIFEKLLIKHPDIPHYLQNNGIKIPAAWLIEYCRWKGYKENDCGVHQNQALVLVNYGQANGRDIYKLSEKIITSVESEFGIKLEREVRVYDGKLI